MKPDTRQRTVAFGPGRVNLIGEHTDYNLGLALPFAIGDGVSVEARCSDGDEVRALAADFGEEDSFDRRSPGPSQGWRAFVRGAVAELRHAGVDVPGAELTITGTVPQGGGLSSSAALEVSLTLALLGLSGEADMDRRALAVICSRVENEWVGARTGLLDQLASLCGEPERALRIDFRSLEVTRVPLELGAYRLVILDSGEKHANAASGYNQRRAECAEACALLGVPSLREATLDGAAELPAPMAQRARHVITENERVEATVAALAAHDLDAVGELINASHRSLRDLFEISTPAVEAAVAGLLDAGARGARIIGGGFGGHVLGLFGPEATAPAAAIQVQPSRGAHLVS